MKRKMRCFRNMVCMVSAAALLTSATGCGITDALSGAKDAVVSHLPFGGWKNPYVDVEEEAWYYDAIEYVSKKDLLAGLDETHFAPRDTMNRAMLVTALKRLSESNEKKFGLTVSTPGTFPDVEEGAWYYDAIQWASGTGLVDGRETGNFDPKGAVTREQLAVIMYRLAMLTGRDINAVTPIEPSAFTDGGEVAPYAVDAVSWACGAGVLAGVDGKLNPKKTATRAEVAAILMRFVEDKPVEKDKDQPDSAVGEQE